MKMMIDRLRWPMCLPLAKPPLPSRVGEGYRPVEAGSQELRSAPLHTSPLDA
tara:strand:- start:412 stop:567 length:156 start_codon:yes stop_codon:yes gene_type:complete